MEKLIKEINSMLIFLKCNKYEYVTRRANLNKNEERSYQEFTYSPNKNIIKYYGWEQSYHNGDHYDCIHKDISLTTEILEDLKIRVLSRCKDVAIEDLQREAEKKEDNKIMDYLKSKGIAV